jgi:hypothetical protein
MYTLTRNTLLGAMRIATSQFAAGKVRVSRRNRVGQLDIGATTEIVIHRCTL